MVVSTASQDFYDLLGVSRDADDAQIKKAFRRLARENHPDMNPGDAGAEERFKAIAEAYEVLSDPERRQMYDRFGHAGLNGGGGGGDPMGGFGSFQDIFSSLFNGDIFGGGGGPSRQPGDDHLVGLEISFVESAQGVTRTVEANLVSLCDTCEATGAAPGSSVSTCEMCGGQGQVQEVMRSALGQIVRRRVCPTCNGAGRVPEKPCSDCRGIGRRMMRQDIELDIPAGIADGQRIRMPGRGHAGDPGAPAGDLYIEVSVAEDERFHRDEMDIVSHVRISVVEAMTGTTVTVPTVDGEEEITVDAGVQPLSETVIKGKGFPQVQGRRRGNHRVVIDVDIPAVTSREGKEFLAGLDEHVESKESGDGLFGRLRNRFR